MKYININHIKEKWLFIVCPLSHIRLFATPWTVAHQSPLSMRFFFTEEYWSVAISFSRGSSQPRNQTYVSCVSCIGRQILTTEPPGKSTIYYVSILFLKVKINNFYKTCLTFYVSKYILHILCGFFNDQIYLSKQKQNF